MDLEYLITEEDKNYLDHGEEDTKNNRGCCDVQELLCGIRVIDDYIK